MNTRATMTGIIMLLLTIAYCWLTWLALGFYSILLSSDLTQLPLVTRLTVYHGLPYPYHALPWQLLAVFSLALNLIVLGRRNSSGRQELGLPLSCHLGWIVFSLCCHGIGMLSPYITVASILVVE